MQNWVGILQYLILIFVEWGVLSINSIPVTLNSNLDEIFTSLFCPDAKQISTLLRRCLSLSVLYCTFFSRVSDKADSTKNILNFTRCSKSIWLPCFALILSLLQQRCSLTPPNEPRRRPCWIQSWIQFRQSRTVVGRIRTGSMPAGRLRAERQPIQRQYRPKSATWIPKRPTTSGNSPPDRHTSGCTWWSRSVARGSTILVQYHS